MVDIRQRFEKKTNCLRRREIEGIQKLSEIRVSILTSYTYSLWKDVVSHASYKNEYIVGFIWFTIEGKSCAQSDVDIFDLFIVSLWSG